MLLVESSRQSEVGKLDMTSAIKENVVWLNVSVDLISQGALAWRKCTKRLRVN